MGNISYSFNSLKLFKKHKLFCNKDFYSINIIKNQRILCTYCMLLQLNVIGQNHFKDILKITFFFFNN